MQMQMQMQCNVMQAVQTGFFDFRWFFFVGFVLAFDFLSYDGVVFFIVSFLTYPSLTSFSFSLSPYFFPLVLFSIPFL
jgi:hypothetical protein